MARRSEKIEDLPFLKTSGEFERYQKLSTRELIVLACSNLDVILGDLLAQRLIFDKKETIEFLGFDDNAKAPLRSFGARIQLCYLLGIINSTSCQALRDLKDLRNKFAHRVSVSVIDDKLFARIKSLFDYLTTFRGSDQSLERTEDDAHRVIFTTFAFLHAMLVLLRGEVWTVTTVQAEHKTIKAFARCKAALQSGVVEEIKEARQQILDLFVTPEIKDVALIHQQALLNEEA